MPRHLRQAWLVPVAAALLLAVGNLLAWSAPVPDPGYLLLDTAVGLSCAVVAGMILDRRRAHLIGVLFAVAGLGLALQAAVGSYAVAALESAWPLEGLAFWLTNWVFFVGLAPLLLLPMFLPDGRLPSPAWRPVLGLLVVLSAVLTVLLMLRDRAWAWGVEVDSPLGNLSTDDVVAPAFGIVMVTFAVANAAAVVSRLRRGGDDQRRQMYPLLAAVIAIAAALVVDTLLPDWPVSIWLVAVTLTLLPVAVAFSVFRYRLFEIEVAVRRTLVYVVASALLLAVYVGVVAVIDAPLLGAAVVAVAFAPLRDAVQRWVSHLLFGDRGDPARALSALGRSLESSSGAPLEGAARTVAVTLRLPVVQVIGDSGEMLSSYGEGPAEGVVVPLLAGGHREGELRVGRRSPDEALSPADRTVLEELARPLALALAAERLSRQVQRSRERLVLAREEERLRIRRELHDGVGPSLAAIGLELDLALALHPAPDGDVGSRATRRARELTGTLITDVRRIVHELRPAALDELGLAGALEDLALTPGADPQVHVVVGELPALPAATEVAAYRIAQEALANAVRHASATAVVISVDVAGHVLCLEILDDGVGVSDGAVEGVGSSSMRERAVEVGGSYRRIRRASGGTMVRAELPL